MNQKILSVDDITTALAPVFRIYNIRSATLFGSYAKRTANAKSDVDLYVDSGLKGLKFVGFTERVQNNLGKPVDIIDKSHITPGTQILNEIESTGVQIYAR